MNPKTGANERAILEASVRFQRVLIFGLCAALIVVISFFGIFVLRDPTKIVPPEVRRPYEIGSSYANREYLSDMATYVLDRVLTVTPASTSYNNGVILRMTHPDGYGPLKTQLDAAALKIKKEQISTVWVGRNEQVNESQLSVKVSGTYKTYISDKPVSEKDKSYIVQFVITSSGRLYVLKIDEVVKPDTPAPAGN
ncbi:conjugal transfer protein TraE [Burkholderia cepacia]|uniref:type IV conjugative transfer system protein TraE n=1 Tax=Burkholderia TaxID=32008 RepID=UPI00075ADA2A|nr:MULTISPECIES: type IV conjugative transfer system protein TraE [Burkholderia]KVV25070.1 conjugal transfer protein TraE [Burkholderia cepacia]